MPILPLEQRTPAIIHRLTDIWQATVLKTHTFLSEADIALLQPEVQIGLAKIESLYAYYDDQGIIQGFIGIDLPKIEMLFVAVNSRGQGIGKQLLNFAVTNLGARWVDVNEQNELGVVFYYHLGFRMISRSAWDSQGRPFPILHLKLDRA